MVVVLDVAVTAATTVAIDRYPAVAGVRNLVGARAWAADRGGQSTTSSVRNTAIRRSPWAKRRASPGAISARGNAGTQASRVGGRARSCCARPRSCCASGENCLIVQRYGRDHLVLLDLGLAKILAGPLISIAPSSASGALIGTLVYVSLEQ